MKNVFKFVGLIVILSFLAGCASILSKSMYPVTVGSHPTGASIVIVDEDGKEIYKGTTPTTLTLESGKAYFDAREYTVRYSKEGYEEQTAVIKPGIDGWYFGNILVGGLIGLIIVDPITGAMWSLPSDVIVTLAEKGGSSKVDQSLKIVTIDQVPRSLKKDLIRIN